MVCPIRITTPPNLYILRLSLAFEFLASQEVKDAAIGNLGLHDRQSRASVLSLRPCRHFSSERAALRWVQGHIESFGGDPTKVTM